MNNFSGAWACLLSSDGNLSSTTPLHELLQPELIESLFGGPASAFVSAAEAVIFVDHAWQPIGDSRAPAFAVGITYQCEASIHLQLRHSEHRHYL